MKILFVACYSPLINNSASIETLQYLNNLAKVQGNEVHLLTVNFPKDSIYYDEYIFNMLDKNVTTHIISGGKIFEKIMPKRNQGLDNNISVAKRSTLKTILKKGKNLVAIPDMYLNWARKASKYGIELNKKVKFDVIFSMHEPPSSHICALKIKAAFREIPWVTYWSDPWLKDSTRENISGMRRRFEENLEKKIVSLSDRFIFVTKSNRDDYIKSYGIAEEKTFIVTRGYDEDEYKKIKKSSKPEKISKNKINFVYAGEIFTKLRDVRPFIEALNNIKDKDNNLYNSINALFFGNIDDEEVKKDLIKVENIQVSSRIPYNEALGYMLNAEVLLLFGNKNSKQIPAKIYDYFGADGFIFIILGDENDPIKEIVQNKDKCIVVNNNKEEITQGIISLMELIKANKQIGPIEEYQWKYISARLNKILEG